MKAIRLIAATVLLVSSIVGGTALGDDAGPGRGEGEIRKIDREAGKVTIKHGPIEGMKDMPAMTMVFRTMDPAMLEKMKVGDRIRFTVSRAGGAMTVLSFEPAS